MRTQQLVRHTALVTAVTLSLSLTACNKTVDDATLSTSIQNRLHADAALTAEPIQTSVLNGNVTLTGSVSSDAARTLASNDVASVTGVKQVINSLTVATAAPSQTVMTAPPAPVPLEPTPGPQNAMMAMKPKAKPAPAPAPVPAPAPAPTPAPVTRNVPPPPVQQAPPPPPPAPAFRNITIPVGTTLPVRVTGTLDSATTQQGDRFTGVIASDVYVDNLVALPAGTPVVGHVDEVHEAAHFKGSSLLTVSVTGINPHGEHLTVTTEPFSKEGKGRGTNTAEKVGGGAAVGAILGGIFGGGKGAAIGAGAGGGLGAGAQAVTRGQQVQIPSETVVRFRTSSSIPVRVSTAAGNHTDGLQHQPMNQ